MHKNYTTWQSPAYTLTYVLRYFTDCDCTTVTVQYNSKADSGLTFLMAGITQKCNKCHFSPNYIDAKDT